MKRHRLDQFTRGWVVGNFSPSLFESLDVEVAVHHFKHGDVEPQHYQLTAVEFTVVVMGKCRIGEEVLAAGDILEISPGEAADFVALSDGCLVAIKSPSLPRDKVLGAPNGM